MTMGGLMDLNSFQLVAALAMLRDVYEIQAVPLCKGGMYGC